MAKADLPREENDTQRPEVDERASSRAYLLPEERTADGSSDAHAQAREVLQEAEERAAEAEDDAHTMAEPIERRSSGETV